MKNVTVTAKSMLHAQGFKLDAESLAALKAKADKHRARDGETGLQRTSVAVYDFHGALIGHLTYML